MVRWSHFGAVGTRCARCVTSGPRCGGAGRSGRERARGSSHRVPLNPDSPLDSRAAGCHISRAGAIPRRILRSPNHEDHPNPSQQR